MVSVEWRGMARAFAVSLPKWIGVIFVTAALLSACGSPGGRLYETTSRKGDTRDSFFICHGYGCSYRAKAQITDPEWDLLRTIFTPPPQDAAAERKRISRAIAMFESIVGRKTGTAGDRSGAAILGKAGQLDCVDETVNTMTYLSFLEQDGLLRFHDIGKAVIRGNVINDWPSNTATIVDRASGVTYTVDSYWHDNGEEPEIVLLAIWMDRCWLERPECRKLGPDEAVACCSAKR